MAQALAETLDSVFMLNSEVDTLSHQIHQKKQTITIQNWELEALQARIREAEERLKLQESMSPASKSDTRHTSNSPHADSSLFGSASSPTSESYRSEEGYTDASTAPSTTDNEDGLNDRAVDDIDCQTIRDVGRHKGKEPERDNKR
ncbi:predicted protein [Uncinocarpus reesii 1704]|uniref:Uncharacterized protein n=1 Tax=Uncinocarpus reesii (strain UAMH 1704) TaxID=336963 RepID=C4JXN6_UNCRE|nr:uncharacterized protein UREG_06409 [Uncinocarpus reesii 1704]EEP81544.1 predicted protein [Uncinocarpus reesii 1704]